MEGKTTAKAKLSETFKNRTSTWVHILRALDGYHAASTARHELINLRAIETLSKEWLAAHGASTSKNDKAKANDLRALLAECVREIDALAAVEQEEYQERLVNTNLALQPTGTAEPEQTKHKADPRYQQPRATDRGFAFITHSATADKVTHSEEHGRVFKPGGTRVEHFGDVRAKPELAGTKLTDGEMAAIRVYSAGDYQTINPVLEGNDSWLASNIGKLTEGGGGETTFAQTRTKAFVKKSGGVVGEHDRRHLKIEAMQHARVAVSGLKKLDDQVVDGYRGFTWPLDQLIPMYKRGATIVYKPFTSTSLKVAKATEYAMVPKEGCVGVLLTLKITHGKDIQAISVEAKEGEVLLLPGATFTVTSPPELKDDGLYHATITQTGAGGDLAASSGSSGPVPLNALPPQQQVPATVTPVRSATDDQGKHGGQTTGRPKLSALMRGRASSAVSATPAAPADPETELKKHAAAAAQTLIATATKAEPGVTSTLQALCTQTKGKLVGLEHRLKTESSLSRKLVDRARTQVTQGKGAQLAVSEEAKKANDVLRYTMVLDEKSYWNNELKMRNALEKDYGYKVTDYWDAWSDKASRAYKGLTLRFATKEGQVFELQIHTLASFDTKMGIHEEYEEARESGTTPERRKALTEYMAGKWTSVPMPQKQAAGKKR